jgi:hypothetical protein
MPDEFDSPQGDETEVPDCVCGAEEWVTGA